MSNVAIDYPNPVLSLERDDYIESCKFNISFNESEITVDDNYIKIPATLELISKGLTDLVNQGKASVVVLINSSAAFFRKVYIFSKNEKEKMIEIPKYNVKRNVEFTGFIVATDSITGFQSEEFSQLYFKGLSFSLKKADILAKGETRIIPVDNSELEKPISSIFMIVRNPEAEKDIETDLDSDDKIIIQLSDKLNSLYYTMKDFNNGSFWRYLTGIIVFPVLVEAIAKMCEYYAGGGQDYSEKRWFRVIEHKLLNLEKKVDLSVDYDNYSYAELADKLLGAIAYDGLKNVKDTIDEEVNGGEDINLGGID